MHSTTQIAVVILNWNGREFLQKFLPSVTSYSNEAKIFVIDNCSDDDSVPFLQQKYPQIEIIINKENYGFAKGYNEGLNKIDADIYCLLNSDVEVTAGWLRPIINLFEKDERIAAIQPKILSLSDRSKFEFAGAAGGLIDHLGYPYCRGRVFEYTEKDLGQYDDEVPVFWASGCAFFIRSQDFHRQKGFDERFFAHQEEIDLCWRLKNEGREIFYCGYSKVYHLGGGTLDKQNPTKTFLNFRNNLSMMLKNLPFPSLLWIIFLRLCLDGVAGIFFGLKHGFSHLWAIVRAHFGFYAQAAETWSRRGRFQRKDYYQSKWLIFRHFLKS